MPFVSVKRTNVKSIEANAFTLVHLSVFELVSIDLALVRFTLTKVAGVPEIYVF